MINENFIDSFSQMGIFHNQNMCGIHKVYLTSIPEKTAISVLARHNCCSQFACPRHIPFPQPCYILSNMGTLFVLKCLCDIVWQCKILHFWTIDRTFVKAISWLLVADYLFFLVLVFDTSNISHYNCSNNFMDFLIHMCGVFVVMLGIHCCRAIPILKYGFFLPFHY